MMIDAFIGLGANLDKPQEMILSAVESYSAHSQCEVKAMSSMYQTKPMGPCSQGDYINAAVWLETELLPEALMALSLDIERQHHRERVAEKRWDARSLDCDILLYGDLQMNDEYITIPHPGLYKRDFVLQPLLDLCPAMILPNGQSITAACQAVSTRYIIKQLSNDNL